METFRDEEEKNEPPKLQLQRKAKFGPFETSFEEENPQEPKSLQSIQWDPFMEPFTNTPMEWHLEILLEFSNTFELKCLEEHFISPNYDSRSIFYLRILH